MKQVKDTYIQIRLPKPLLEDLNRYYGSKRAKVIRGVIESMIEAKKQDHADFLHCSYCHSNSDIIDDMVALPRCEIQDGSAYFIICKKCFDKICKMDLDEEIEKLKAKEITEFDKIKAHILCIILFEDGKKIPDLIASQEQPNGITPTKMIAKATTYYPRYFDTFPGLILIKEISDEELGEALDDTLTRGFGWKSDGKFLK